LGAGKTARMLISSFIDNTFRDFLENSPQRRKERKGKTKR
jgi:hypothetical protein